MITQITDRERHLAAERDRYQEAADKMAAEHKAERDALAAENERLLAANRDCVEWFDALKSDYDKLREAAKLGLDALDAALSDDQPYIDKSKQAIAALKEALGEK